MKFCLGWTALLVPAVLLGQPQIGGGQCSSASLNGVYSLTLSGRQLSQRNSASGTGLGFANVIEGLGSANFDGLSKVTFTWTSNTPAAAATAQSWTGTYTLQANCVGAVAITGGDMATFTLGAYNSGGSFALDGYDGAYSFNGNGSVLPATCTAALLNGTYSFNGNGFVLSSGAIGTVSEISGLLTFDGVSVASGNWYVSIAGGTANAVTTGSFTVNSNCLGSATLSDATGNKYTLQLVITAPKGTNFLVDGASPSALFIGAGRTL